MSIQQQALPFSRDPDYGSDVFIVSDCNRLAHEALVSWPHWLDAFLVIEGPSFSGKTHMAHLWAEKSKATFMRPGDPLPPTGHVIIDPLTPHDLDESLFHLINRVREEKRFCLILTRENPCTWPCPTRDLSSRLEALVRLPLLPPDLDHMAGVLQKNLADHQVRMKMQTVHRLLLHSQRSYGAIKDILLTHSKSRSLPC